MFWKISKRVSKYEEYEAGLVKKLKKFSPNKSLMITNKNVRIAYFLQVFCWYRILGNFLQFDQLFWNQRRIRCFLIIWLKFFKFLAITRTLFKLWSQTRGLRKCQGSFCTYFNSGKIMGISFGKKSVRPKVGLN